MFIGSGFEPNMELFPGQDAPVSVGGKNYVLTAFFEDALEVKSA